MALLAQYQSFVARPNADALAPEASIHYLPTLSSVSSPAAIVKHYAAQAQQLVKRNERVTTAFESGDKLCVETDTTIEFTLGGGTFLPGLDDNFIGGRSVTLPVVHIVQFNEQQKIRQIRIFWDQACLLKGVEVIGRSGHSWPIREGKDQCRLLGGPAEPTSTDEDRAGRSRFRGGANGDKYTTLQLFQPREFVPRDETPANPVAPRPTAKPADRDFHDLFAAGAEMPPPERSASPTKNSNPLKGGAGKGYGENRLFDEKEETITSPTKPVDPKKYNHFEFGETEFVPKPTTSKASKHASQWDFEDFITPVKPRERFNKHNERNFGWSDDEDDAAKPLVHLPHNPQPRPDSVPHFEFKDDTPTQAKPRPVSQRGDHGLYVDHVLQNEDESPSGETKMPLGNITNQAGHRKAFSSQFEIQDDSPNDGKSQENAAKKPDPNRTKVLKTLERNWSLYDQSPDAVKERGINIAGDGMGSRKAPGEKPWWEFE